MAVVVVLCFQGFLFLTRSWTLTKFKLSFTNEIKDLKCWIKSQCCGCQNSHFFFLFSFLTLRVNGWLILSTNGFSLNVHMISLHLSKWIFYFKFLDAMWKSDIPKKKLSFKCYPYGFPISAHRRRIKKKKRSVPCVFMRVKTTNLLKMFYMDIIHFRWHEKKTTKEKKNQFHMWRRDVVFNELLSLWGFGFSHLFHRRKKNLYF